MRSKAISAALFAMLLGVAALRAAGPNGKRILYDAGSMRFTNATDGNRFLTREYRAGWSL